MKQFKSYKKDADWFFNHFDEIANKYKGGVVAVKKGKIVATNENINDLIEELKVRGEIPAMLFIGTILPDDEIIIF